MLYDFLYIKLLFYSILRSPTVAPIFNNIKSCLTINQYFRVTIYSNYHIFRCMRFISRFACFLKGHILIYGAVYIQVNTETFSSLLTHSRKPNQLRSCFYVNKQGKPLAEMCLIFQFSINISWTGVKRNLQIIRQWPNRDGSISCQHISTCSIVSGLLFMLGLPERSIS